MNWHTLTIEETMKRLHTQTDGLDEQDVQARLLEHGKNELVTGKRTSVLMIFLRQFVDVMILILAAAGVISAVVGEMSDTIVILIIIILNAIIGFIQEYRAERAMEALQKMAAPTAKVKRNGRKTGLAASELVPGDVVLVEAGDAVPADIRLIEAVALKANEASLTGESAAVDKQPASIAEEDRQLAERFNMVYKGTSITNGHGTGIVVSTGMKTELGKIADMLDKADGVTPLQKRLSAFSRKITVIIIFLCIGLFVAGYLRGEPINQLLLTSISLAVAAIPEALPAVITISLALGARRLLGQNALMRRLHAVETLGSVTYICTDKTGTLTKNEMEVRETWVPDEVDEVVLKEAMALNHDVTERDGQAAGDPTEIALITYAGEPPTTSKLLDLPFDSDRKAMTTVHEHESRYRVVTKGATESIAAMLKDQSNHENIRRKEEEMASEGMRVIAYAQKFIDDLPQEGDMAAFESQLEFVGLAGLVDPPREEAKAAIKECQTAGIITVMITGDHPLTAAAIGREIGIINDRHNQIMTGAELAEKDPGFLERSAKDISVYARVSPEQKLNIVDALQRNGQFVSMTGDGVNDAPSLKKANIGVAMGITGTDVTKEAADMILLDDNFATIVKAVREGRRVYDNIRKFLRYILTGNTAEIWAIFLAPILGLPIPLVPVQILWVNLVTDGLPALALAAEPAEKNIMQRPPRKPNESIFADGLGIHVIWVGIFIGLLTVGAQAWLLGKNVEHWQTIVFTILCFCQLWHVLAIRSETRSLFKLGLLSNKSLLWAVLGTVALQIAVIYVPFLNSFLHTQPLTAGELALCIGVSTIVFVVVEIEKLVRRRMGGAHKGV
ncbi:MAG: cation-translocating P-type ATPase [Chitinophagaceae bacterium]|nr:MAG: cation-translocating P-type ATPase [Chitinophagaceae bacterium]